MNNKKTLFVALLCFSGVPAAVFIMLAIMEVSPLIVAFAALVVVAAGVTASWEFSRRFDARYANPLRMLRDFFQSTAEKDVYLRCDLTGVANETAEAYNNLIEKFENKYNILAGENIRLKTKGEELSAENDWLHNRERDLIDIVTGLPNRTAFERCLRELLAQKLEGGLVYVDVDDFLYINNMIGRDAGDRLLHEIGIRLSGIAIAESFCARYGDDKFVALVIGSKKDIEMFCRYLAEEFARSFMPGEAVLRIKTGVGAVMFNEATGVEELVDYASHAMRRSREVGARYYFFDELIHGRIQRSAQILSILRDSICKNEMFLVYQPQISLDSGKVKVLEVLLRLKNKELGYISPAEFIPIAEANGMMLQLGYWAIEAACGFLKRSAYTGIVAVNISPIQIFDNMFVEKVTNIIENAEISPSRIMLEIKEYLAENAFNHELPKLNGLRKLGVDIAMDNFGVMYSSLNHMAKLPIDTVKIDRVFINGLFTDHRKRVIVRAIIETAHTFGLSVCAEGVEEDEQYRFLYENGCDMIQGYIFSAPLDECGIVELIERHG